MADGASMVQDGEIGELLHIDGYFTFRLTDTGNIRMRPETGGGVTRDIGVYTLGSARLATGLEPENVQSRFGWQNGVDVSARIWANFAGGATCSIYMSMEAPNRQVVTYHGTDGFIELTAPFNPVVHREASVRVVRADGGRTAAPLPLGSAIREPGGGLRTHDPRRGGLSRASSVFAGNPSRAGGSVQRRDDLKKL